MPKEIQILLNGLEEIEGILYGMRQQIAQQYGPVEYSHIQDIELCFPKEQADKLTFERIPYTENWIIRPKAYLGNELFAKISANVTELGGSYDKGNHYFVVKRK